MCKLNEWGKLNSWGGSLKPLGVSDAVDFTGAMSAWWGKLKEWGKLDSWGSNLNPLGVSYAVNWMGRCKHDRTS